MNELTRAATDVLAERRRQVEAEGWGPNHDDEHDSGELAAAAASYAGASIPLGGRDFRKEPPGIWPWGLNAWKPTDPRRNLVKAGALILAEIERLDRLAEDSINEGHDRF